MPVFREELGGSPRRKVSRKGQEATRVFRINWEDIEDFIDEVFIPPFYGSSTFIDGKAEPFSEDHPFIVADEMTIEPFQEDGEAAPERDPGDEDDHEKLNKYVEAGARVEIIYKSVEWQEDTENEDEPITFLTWRRSIGGEVLTLPKAGLSWETAHNGSKVYSGDASPGVIIPMIDHQLVWHFVIKPPFVAIKENVGKINEEEYLGCDPETLLFLGSEDEHDFTSKGERAFTITYRFQERIIRDGEDVRGWNYFLRDATGEWELLFKANGDKIYEVTDFSPLFTPGGGSSRS